MIRDYVCKVVSSLVAPLSEQAGDARLLWVNAASPNEPARPVAFAFKPVYSYEHAAVDTLGLRDVGGGWYQSPKSSDLVVESLLDDLLEHTVWRGRPVLDSRLIYWHSLKLDRRAYRDLRRLAKQSTDRPLCEESDDLFSPDKHHNLHPAAAELLTTLSEGYGWAFENVLPSDSQPNADSKVVEGDAHNPAPQDLALAIAVSGRVNLWFMPDDVLVVQWHLEPVQRFRFVGDRELDTPLSWVQALTATPATVFDDWIRLSQSIRWLQLGFDKQHSEGKKLNESLLNALLYDPAGKIAALPHTLGKRVSEELIHTIQHGAEPRAFSQLGVSVFTKTPGRRFNTALERVFTNTLSVDVYFGPVNDVTDNHAASADFTKRWTHRRRYDRWRDTGLVFGFSDYSAVAVGTSAFFTSYQVLGRDFPGLYAHLVRLVLYQRTVLRELSRDLGKQRIGEASVFQKDRKRYQEFLQHGWFQYASEQVQPNEMVTAMHEAMELERLFAAVRDEITDAGAFIDTELEKQGNKIENDRNRLFAVLGLLIGAPGVLELWREDTQGWLQPLASMLADSQFWFATVCGCFGYLIFKARQQD